MKKFTKSLLVVAIAFASVFNSSAQVCPAAVPYQSDFSTFLPTCWEEADSGDEVTGPTGLGVGSWSQSGSLARINLFATGKSDWLLTPEFDLSAGGWELIVEASGQDFGAVAGTFSGMGSDDSVQVLISTDGGTSWTTLFTFDAANPLAVTSTDYIIDLSAYTGTSNLFGILATEGAVNDPEDYYPQIHSFEIRQPLTCVEPTLLTVSNIATATADVSWTAGGGSSTEVRVLPSGSPAPTGGNPLNGITNNPETVTGLMPNTSYDTYIRDICAGGSPLVISGVYDMPLTGGTPKGVELYVIEDIADLSVYGVSSANNGSGATGTPEFTFPSVSAAAGSYIYVSSSAAEFQTYFGFLPDHTSVALSINGDDAIELFFNGTVVDVFGDVNVDGTGQSWEYLDGWAYRNAGEVSNGGTFDALNWTFSGTNAVDGCTDNATCASVFPIGTYTTSFDVTAWVGPVSFTTPCLPFDGDDAATPIVISGLTVSETGNTDQCFTDQNAGPGIGHDAPDAWYQYTLDGCTDSLIVSLCGSSFDTYLAIYAANGTTLIFDNDDNFSECGPGNNSHIELDLNTTAGISAGDVIYIVVDGFGSNSGGYSLNIDQIQAPTPVIDSQTACDSLSWNGTTYTASGQYSFLGTDVNGCDSLTILDLTISNSTSGTDVITVCDSLTWIDGVTYFASTNTPTFTIVGGSSNGCDSIVTLDLTIVPNTAPVPDAASLPDVTGECSVASITAPTATDDCSGTITGTPDVTFPITAQGTTVVTWTFDDGAGLTTTQTQNVIIDDVTPPTASNPVTLNVQCAGDVPPATPSFVTDEADNCGTPVVAFVSEVSDGQTCPETLTRTFSVTDAGGNAITVTQTIIINDDVVPVSDVPALADLVGFCDLTPATPTATDNCSGTIDGVADVTFPINTVGTTVVTWTFTDDCGNSTTQTQNVVVEQININTFFASDGITIVSSNNDAGVTFQWIDCNDNNQQLAGETNQNFTPTFSSDFAVIVTQDGCSDTSACVTITEVGIGENEMNALQVYPNPVKDFVKVDMGSLTNVTLQLIDVNGKVLFTKERITDVVYTFEMNQAPGVYFIEVQSNELVKRYKVVKAQ